MHHPEHEVTYEVLFILFKRGIPGLIRERELRTGRADRRGARAKNDLLCCRFKFKEFIPLLPATTSREDMRTTRRDVHKMTDVRLPL